MPTTASGTSLKSQGNFTTAAYLRTPVEIAGIEQRQRVERQRHQANRRLDNDLDRSGRRRQLALPWSAGSIGRTMRNVAPLSPSDDAVSLPP